MDERDFEREIKSAINKNTNDYLKDKEGIWSNIEAQLNLKKQEKEVSRRNNSKKVNGLLRGILISAAIFVVIFSVFATSSSKGQVIIAQIKQYFEPEKHVITEIEGNPEEQEVILHEKADYIIYIDEERYKMIQDGDKDIITTKEPLEERYPEVSMTISQVVDKTPEVLAQEYSEELKTSFATVKEIESVTEPVEGLLVAAIDGDEWDSKVSKIYIISNGKEGSFVFDLKYFLEAAEGHGARFYHLLDEFKIVQE